MNTNLGDVPMEPPPPEEDERRVRSTGATASSSTMSSSTTMTSNPTTTTGRPHFAPQAEEAQRRFRREQEEREEEEEEEEEELNQESDGESSHKSGDSNSAHVHSSSTGSSPSRTMPSVLRPPSISTQPQLGRPTYHLAPRTTSTPSTSFLTPPTYEQYEYGNMDNRGQKRRLNQTDFVPQTQRTMPPPPPPPSSDATSTRMGPAHDDDAADDPLHFETRGSHGPRDESRYETWTSKQLRKKCSHLKLRGLKNVKKHVMVEALYRFYRNQRSGGGGYTSTNTSSPSHPRYTDDAYFSHGSTGHGYASHPTIMHRGRASSSTSLPVDGSPSMNHRPSPSTTGHHKSLSPHRPTHPYHHASLQDDTKVDSFDNEVRITSDDVIRLVDVMLSSDFVDRLTSELSRWQFWVDVREKYIRKLKEQHEMDSYSAARGLTALGERDDALSRLPLTSYSRNARWSSMQLWEMWKELTFAYTKTCFEFTTAGADECDYIHYCKGRPDVYYLHQRLHARPDLLHLIKSNEYIDEKHTGEDSNSTTAAMDVAVGSPAPPSTSVYATPTVESTAPAPPSSYNGKKKTTERDSSPESAVNASSSEATNPPPRTKRSNVAEAAVQYLRNNSPTEGSTENSETTGEDASMEKTNSNSGSRTSQQRGEELTEQKYFGLLLQNFEAIFESLHNKKVLLAALRKDKSAPDHLIADLHDDIHVLSALKKEFRSKLRQTLE